MIAARFAAKGAGVKVRVSGCLALVLVAAAACTQFPELDRTESPYVADAAYPDLLPISDVLTTQPARAVPELRGDILGRVAALRARAQRLSGPVHNRATRARLRKKITLPQ